MCYNGLMIPVCQPDDKARTYFIISEAAKAYEGVIPGDRHLGGFGNGCLPDGDDPIFAEYKTIIAPSHLTPGEALVKAYRKSPEDMPERLSVVS
ncbi:hypothetical protein M1O18_00920 [Dehalococcoidia bacterium]|nr:hypothetical protein [Dehalococcoidia bacterium]